jgi:hypothetical protein
VSVVFGLLLTWAGRAFRESNRTAAFVLWFTGGFSFFGAAVYLFTDQGEWRLMLDAIAAARKG